MIFGQRGGQEEGGGGGQFMCFYCCLQPGAVVNMQSF